jgi:hypothetical protein
MRLHPINPAESVFAPFFDPGLDAEAGWTAVPGVGTRGFRKARGYTTMFHWDEAIPGIPAFGWEWHGTLDLTGFDGLFLQAAFPATVTLRLHVTVAGGSHLVVDEPGCDTHEDYTGRLPGPVVTALRIELVPSTNRAGAFSIYYIGAHNDRKLADWTAFESPTTYPPKWSGFIRPASQWSDKTYAPDFGMMFSADELESLRAKMSKHPYSTYAAKLRERARRSLSDSPERRIRHYAPCGEQPFAYSARSRDRGEPFWAKMELSAFFGLVDHDPELVTMAARYALSLAHCDLWSEGFVEHDFRGSAMNWRAFYQNYAALALSNTLDWIGFALTDHAKEVIRHSLFFKALTPLKHDFHRYEYIYHMNQAVVFSYGRIASDLALAAGWPRLGDEIESARKDLDESAHEIVHADGGYGEGPGYYSAVLYFLFGSYLLLARRLGTDAATMVPPGAHRCADYLGAFIATSGEGRRLAISDGGTGALQTDWLAMAAAVTKDERWNGLFESMLESSLKVQLDSPMFRHGLGTSVRTLIYGPADLSKRRELVPVFTIHAGTGHATSRRDTASGAIRLHLCGSSADEGHSHGDKGAIILAAADRIDRPVSLRHHRHGRDDRTSPGGFQPAYLSTDSSRRRRCGPRRRDGRSRRERRRPGPLGLPRRDTLFGSGPHRRRPPRRLSPRSRDAARHATRDGNPDRDRTGLNRDRRRTRRSRSIAVYLL